MDLVRFAMRNIFWEISLLCNAHSNYHFIELIIRQDRDNKATVTRC